MSLILFGAMLLGYLQIKNMNKAADILTEASVPIFVRAQEIGHSLTELALMLQAVENVRGIDDLDPLKREFADRLVILKQDINMLMENQAASEMVVEIVESVDQIGGGVNRLLQVRREIVQYDLAIDRIEGQLKASQANAKSALEQLTDDMPQGDGQGGIGHLMSSGGIEQAHARNLRQAIAIGLLRLEIDTVIISAKRLQQAPNGDAVERIEHEILAKLDSIAQSIPQLKDSPARATLEMEISAIRDGIFGNTGILVQVRQMQDLRRAFAEMNLQENSSIQAVSVSSANLIETTNSRVKEASDQLDGAVRRVAIFLIGAGLVSILVFGAANVLIVEKQINQRMSRLTKAVAAIVANEAEYEIDVEGHDELADMARALKAFKSTAEELRRSNTELEKFAYVAAHDLRSPLRAIQDLAEWTVEDEENQFSEQGLENMEMLQSRVNRLNQILADLLAYSRVGKENEDLTTISMPKIVQTTSEMLDPNDRFKIVYSGTTSEIVTYATPLRQIMLNLVSNSIKHHDKDTGTIRISAKVVNHRLNVEVQDDGPGIEPQYHDRIFGLFQTLRSRDEVEGSGLGLAIIRKLVEHYGGTIRLTSNPAIERGAKFQFDMPEKSDVHFKRKLAA